MKSISVELPDNLASAVESYVKAGFFRSELDVLLAALSKFVRRNRIELKERFAREDIEWAKKGSLKKSLTRISLITLPNPWPSVSKMEIPILSSCRTSLELLPGAAQVLRSYGIDWS